MNNFDANHEFFNSLHGNICNEQTQLETNIPVCLIINEPITCKDDIVTLLCGHTFSYNAIFNEVYHRKFVVLKNRVKLKNNQIQCPYCRNIQKGLIPYKKGYQTILYVNKPLSMTMKTNTCTYVLKGGKRKGEMCDKACHTQFCSVCQKKVDKQKDAEVHKVSLPTCNSIMKSGKNKGLPCKKKCVKNSLTCGLHILKSIPK